MTLPFGKYLDVELDQVPDKYLMWLIAGGTAGLDPKLAEEIHAALHRSAVRGLTGRLRPCRMLSAEMSKRVRAFLRLARKLGVTEEATHLERELDRLTKQRAANARKRKEEQIPRGRPLLRAEAALARIPPSAAHEGSTQGIKGVS